MDDGLIITHIDQFIEPEPMEIKLGFRRPTGIHANCSAIPWEVFRLDGEPLIDEDLKNGHFVESDLVPNPE